jgi:glycosyltransferase involved in cell wall biosynthesis
MEIDKLIEKSHKIVFTGFIKNDELYKYYQVSDLLTVPSICEEASGLTVIEGLISGLPLIITNSGGMPENVSELSAFIVERDKYLIENIAAKIKYLYNNDQIYHIMSDAAITDSLEFSREKYYNDFLTVFGD